ncbi:MAG: HigA family addiction module antitoxin [Candidatus Ornithomonoglobus sp.]
MAQKITGLSLDYIIHPGETLSEILEDRNMSQKELAIRTSVSEKHISKVINGKSNISAKFAKSLEYAIGIDASFWMNLQSNYDVELEDFKSENNITEEELSIGKKLRDVITAFSGFFKDYKEMNAEETVVYLRNKLNISDLTNINTLAYNASFRIGTSDSVDQYILYTWIKFCELLSAKKTTKTELNTDKLKSVLPQIRALMSVEDINIALSKLTEILSDCGIIFHIVKNVQGAPVQGFIEKRTDGRAILFLTIRGKYADIFWFSLFHEIAHILNGDIDKNSLVDYQDIYTEKEQLADNLAANLIINETDYKYFTNNNKINIYTISRFSEKQGIPVWMVVGRLQKDGKIPYSYYSQSKIKYEWTI